MGDVRRLVDRLEILTEDDAEIRELERNLENADVSQKTRYIAAYFRKHGTSAIDKLRKVAPEESWLSSQALSKGHMSARDAARAHAWLEQIGFKVNSKLPSVPAARDVARLGYGAYDDEDAPRLREIHSQMLHHESKWVALGGLDDRYQHLRLQVKLFATPGGYVARLLWTDSPGLGSPEMVRRLAYFDRPYITGQAPNLKNIPT